MELFLLWNGAAVRVEITRNIEESDKKETNVRLTEARKETKAQVRFN